MTDKKVDDGDVRLEFIASYVMKTHRIKLDKWQKMMASDDKIIVLDWLNNPQLERLCFGLSSSGSLAAYNAFPATSKGKICYFIRKHAVPLTSDNLRDVIIFGDLSPKPMNDISILLDEVYYPILNNPANQEGWPEVIKKDIDLHIQDLRNIIAEVKGNISNQTLLPMPITIDKVLEVESELSLGNVAACDIKMKNSLEGIVIKWAFQIDEVLKETSASLFDNNNHPMPLAELKFWDNRRKNVMNLYDQLRDPRVKKIGTILETINSVYFNTFRSTFKNVVTALHEANDITLWLKPLAKHFDTFDKPFEEDSDEHPEENTDLKIRPLYHCICLMWAHSKYYGLNSRMITLFRMVNNMMIEAASKTLDPTKVFDGEPADKLAELVHVINILELHKTCFTEYRDKLQDYVLPDKDPFLWTFRPKDIFGRFDLFMDRLYVIRDIFETATEFFKLDKVELGGLKGRILSRGIGEVNEEFKTLFAVWPTIEFNPLDPDPKVKLFEREQLKFKDKADTMERRVAAILTQSFDECFTMESLIKLIEVCTTLLLRPIIHIEIKDKLENLLDLYNEDLDKVKAIFDYGIEVVRVGGINALVVDRGFPPVSGALVWVKKLKTRILKPTEEIPNIEFMHIFETEDAIYTLDRLKEMCTKLEAFEAEVFTQWKTRVPNEINTNMQKFLLKRTAGDLLELNFDTVLVAALKEVKSFRCMGKDGIPDVATELFENSDDLWTARVMLSRIVEWYNEIKDKTVPCEFDIIRQDIEAIDDKLHVATDTATWCDYEQVYINDVHADLKNLNSRVLQAENNVEMIIKSLRLWGSEPMYERHDNVSTALMLPEDFPGRIIKRQMDCQQSKKLIDDLVDENFRLYFNFPLKPKVKKITETERQSTMMEYSRHSSLTDEVEEEQEIVQEEQERPSEVNVAPTDKSAQVSHSSHSLKSAKSNKSSFSTKSTSTETNYEIIKKPSQLELFRPYEEYIDSLIGSEILDAIVISIKYLKNEMENRYENNAAIFEVKLELQIPQIVFWPELVINFESPRGLQDIIESMIGNIYNISDMIPLVAQPLENTSEKLETFTLLLESKEGSDIQNMQMDILSLTRHTIKDAIKFSEEFEKYNFLWLTEKRTHLEEFLRYGRILTPEEADTIGDENCIVKEHKPELVSFKSMIDYYGELYEEINQIPTLHVFNIWLNVDMNGLKQNLLNQVCKWSHLFKQYLKDKVIYDLMELQDFIIESTYSLKQEATNDDFPTLLLILKTIESIHNREYVTDNMFQPLKEIVDLLKSYDMTFDEKINDQFAELPEKWITLKKTSLYVKQAIAPIQAYQVDLIKKRISLFDLRSKLYRENFKKLAFFRVPCRNVYDICDVVNNELTDMETQVLSLHDSAVLFELNPPEESKIRLCRREVKMIKQIWDFFYAVTSCIEDWKKTPWKRINVEDMEQECKKFSKDMRTLDKDMRNWEAFMETEGMIKNLLTSLRAITELQNPAIRERHWVELMHATKVRFEMNDSTTLADLLALQLHKFEEEVKTIVDKSVKEMGMEKVLRDLNNNWKVLEFETDVHERTKLKVVRVSEEILESLEENQVQLQSLMSSKFIAHFLEDVSTWQTKLSNADQVISSWMEVQRKWMYLESIFIGSEDIRNQLPIEAKRFEDVDRTFKSLLADVCGDLNVVRATNKPNLFDKLDALLKQLILCEKALNDYLETKRLAYPRFYFVSSADLLDILSNGNAPELVARHLTKLYDSIAKMVFGKGTKIAQAMISKENDEHVDFNEPCDCSGKVEIWLNKLTDAMRQTLHHLFRLSVIAYEDKPRETWVFDWPAQPALCTTQIWWTLEVNIAFVKLEEGYENSLKVYQAKQIAQLNSLIFLLLGDLCPGDRQKIMTICTIDVHSRDVVAKMIVQKVENSNAFQWQTQLRHRWDKDQNDCFANICDAEFRYDYEYLGNTPRLVITPLTDRCYITLTQSLHLVMGGAPAGPAGTGKTETTKDLGRALGVMVYVFNCSEQMDYKSCGNIYKGLSQTGAWGCFDEFNRISVEVLSVVAVQVKSIQDAIKAKKLKFNFMGEIITLVPTIGLFITMNPGYAGRTELPENLKALFRPCAMVVPDFELICEIMLVAEGFQEARLLARKFITLYTLCRELLSKQDHYDWGLRAIKSVLVVAGALKRGDRQRPEDQVLMRALRDFNVPKIVTADTEIFLGLIGDLFPALDVPRKTSPEFEAIIQKSTIEMALLPEPGFILKVVQLEELFAVRHSVFIVGNAGTGKSQVWKALFKTYQNQKRKPHFNDLNPKAVTNDELFGVINPATREWKDGLFSIIMRDQANLPGNGPKWIILDGDIDPMWIESLNTVMDDNKVLTLASNERIALTKEMRLLFEISNLRTATPATVSRAGILYINPQDLGWSPSVNSWINTRTEQSEKSLLTVLFEKYIPPLLDSHKRFKKITPISEIAMIQMTCFLLDCLLTPQNVPSECPKDWYETYFVFAVIWGFGSACFQDQLLDWRNEFSKWWNNEFKVIKFPPFGTVFNYFIDPETKQFLPWSDLVPKYEMDIDIPLQSTLVPTTDTTRLRWFMDILIEKKHPVMLVGGAGSGKSVIVSDKLQQLSDNYVVQNVPFNFYSTSEMLQKVLEKPLEKKAGRNFGPPGGKQMIYFIDDMNMPMVDNYGTVQAHTIIRQFIDYHHWYDRAKLTLKDIQNCQFVSSMNPTAGSFTIDPRLQRHFCVFSVNFPIGDPLYHIYYEILSQHLSNPSNKFNTSVQKIAEPLITGALNLHSRMSQIFLPTAVKFHYVFNMRDLANIFQGMLFGNGETCPEPNQLIQLWIHEANRVYGDKLVEQEDIEAFDKLCLDVVKKSFEAVDENAIFVKPLIFCHFAEGLLDPKYMPVKKWPTLNALLEEAQMNYNELVGSMNLVLFEDAMAHICRISRILECPRGNALLIGVGGSGKQSLARLAAFISNLEVSQIQLKKGYSIVDMKADLALLYIKTGIKNVSCMHLMTDSQVAEESYLVLINDMLASGEINELFTDDEVDQICNGVRNELKQLGILDTKENCWRHFIDKVRKMLKTVLCFSPVGSTLRIRARKFPAIVNCTAIDWFHEWPQNALESVSKRFLSDVKVLPVEILDSVSVFMAYVHETVNEMSGVYFQNEKRYNYTTPKSFLELISLFSKLLAEKDAEYKERVFRLENGLIKLAQCAEQAEVLKKELAGQEVELKVKNDAADILIATVNEENEKVSKSQNEATEKGKKVNMMKETITAEKKSNEEDLRKAKPALDRAADALNTLNKTNLTELKSFGSPPEIVVKVCAAVLVLFSPKGRVPRDRSWKQSKLMMNKVDEFLYNLINFDKDNIPSEVIKEINVYKEDPEFDGEKIESRSLAAAGLAKWVVGIVGYNEVYLTVEPKIRAVRESEVALADAQAEVDELEAKVEALEKVLSDIKAKQDDALGEKQKCQDEADKTAHQIDLAYRLVNGLQSENVRWRDLIYSFQAKLVTLPGDILLISCFISYVGCFTRRYRLELLTTKWIPTFLKIKPEISFSEFADPLALICDDAQIAQWNNEGLPSDRMSTENAVILMSSSRWPLMIDPQLQGLKWIKQKFGDKLIVLRLTNKGYLDVIEQAITNGDTLLIENIDETVDAVLDPLLGRILIKKGKVLKIGDREIDFNQNFRLILQTKLANPHYKPEMQAQTTLINFTVTRDGLEEQLLAEVVKAERPDLEKQKSTLTQEENRYKIVLKQYEDDLLSRLSSAGENVLEDASLVYNLEKTKKTSAEIEIKRDLTKTTSAKIDIARESYRPAAERASIIYFILNELHKINPIYQFSLKAFTVVFKDAIVKTPPSEELDERVLSLIESITFAVFMYTSRGLFEKDKLIFMSQLVIQILMQAKEIVQVELDFLLRFPYTPGMTSPLDCLSNICWGGIHALNNLEEFRSIDKDIESSPNRWKKFVETDAPEKQKLPGEWKQKTALQRLCILRCLRPDRMTYAMREFIREKLGSKFVEARSIEFIKSFEECSNVTPIFFILSAGVDPLKDVEKIGKRMKFANDYGNFHNVSLGQGQEIVAENAIELASRQGHWVILQNIHLVAKWLSTLEKKMEATMEDAHENYRLFVSAEPAESAEYHIIPQGILESAIKITNEPPTGMQANMHKSLDNFNQETLEMCSKESEFKSVLFALCYFHAVVAERRKFGPQGWNRSYPFNVGDLTISVYVLYNYLEANSKVPWEDLRYLFGEIMYGGHITDDWDRRLCRTYLEEMMQQELVDGDLQLATGFPAPPNTDYTGYHNYIDTFMPPESPVLYGLHPNAEIGFLSTLSDQLFKTIFELQPRDSGGSGGGLVVSRDEVVRGLVEDLYDKLPEEFIMTDLYARTEDRSPFVIVAFQECERMNTLINELKTSLREVKSGLKGELTISPDMEALMESVFFDKIPERWSKKAYPSLLGLQSWFADLMVRSKELETWSVDFNLPSSVWLAGFFNPQSFLTAIMQQTARKNEWALDKMCLNCDVTKKSKEDFSTPPREGAYINGLYMEGARWDTTIGGIVSSRLKELFPLMPVIFIRAIPQDKQDNKNIYECPLYKTRSRGQTFVWTFNLKTKERPAKWTLGGVGLLLQI